MFFLAGNRPQERSSSRGQESRGRSTQADQSNNIFSGFDTEILFEAFGVDKETARKLQNIDQSRGFIVKVNNLQVSRPTRRSRRSDNNDEKSISTLNGMEELMCTMELVRNIDDPTRATDIYHREAGYLSDARSGNLPILYHIKLGASRGHLRHVSAVIYIYYQRPLS